ncbi:flavin reductase family protein [Rheinheimera sp. 4Y26]|uniref:flavin reductase family protein n=1 Tax=Rheinheimera sp. 4Y26 TaxID=2977811 RepID=UPI0021B0AC2E|nr:FAD-binding oxidoreductase [Rheinheimera sp. 4Y26]MCT6699203.1 FAD-binding oxidoreductase [Rheinheimera sp. 4Y26]
MRSVQSSIFNANSQSEAGVFRRLWRLCCQIALVQSGVRSYLEPVIRLMRPNYRAGLQSATLLSISQQQGDLQDAYLQLQLKAGRSFAGFVPGQHLDLTVELDGVLVTRTFSISSPLQQFWQHRTLQLTMKVQPHGGLTQQLFARAGEPLPCYIGPASGDFVLEQSQSALMLAAGSGITPLHSMLSSLSRLTRPITLIYSYRGAGNLLFADSWPQLRARFPLLTIVLRDTCIQGRLTDAEFSAALSTLKKQDGECLSAGQSAGQSAGALQQTLTKEPMLYLCGPLAFSQYWQQQAKALGISQVRQESFGLSQQSHGEAVPVSATQHGGTLQFHSQGNLLKSLEQAGLSPRYGCRRGICMQCLCTKTSGQVRNELTGHISDAGEGLVQLCISSALTKLELQLDAVSTAAQDNTSCTT